MMSVLKTSGLLIHVLRYRKNGAKRIVFNYANPKTMQKTS